MKTTEEMIAVMQAYVDGKMVQTKIQTGIDSESGWEDIETPGWQWFNYDYRVKPELKLRAYRTAEEVLTAVTEHGPYVKDGNTYHVIEKFIEYGNGDVGYTFSGWNKSGEMHTAITWADGSPFGIEMEDGEDENL